MFTESLLTIWTPQCTGRVMCLPHICMILTDNGIMAHTSIWKLLSASTSQQQTIIWHTFLKYTVHKISYANYILLDGRNSLSIELGVGMFNASIEEYKINLKNFVLFKDFK